jgi:hypothetical protein
MEEPDSWLCSFLSSDRLHSESGYMSSPERGGPRGYPAAAYPPGGPGYEDPYYSQYASRSGSITPVIDEEARWAGYIVKLHDENFVILVTYSKHSSFTNTYHYATGSLWRRQSLPSFNTLTPFYFLSHSLHVSAPTGHPQVRYTISYLKDYFLIQQIRCTHTIWYRDVICCISVLQLVVLIHVIILNLKIKIVKSAKFHVTSGVQKRFHI